MIIKETPVFTRRVIEILTDDEYKELQAMLAQQPDIGSIIPGGGGLRKVRWSIKGKGKRGGSRVIYYWFVEDESILMLFIFKKNERSDLTKEQLKQLRTIVEREYDEK